MSKVKFEILEDKVDLKDVEGNGTDCWNDCEVWSYVGIGNGNPYYGTPLCEYKKTGYSAMYNPWS